MISRQVHSTSRRTTIELLVVATLSGFGPDFPAGVSGTPAWKFVVQHPTELLHAVGGVLVLAECSVLLIRLFGEASGATVRVSATVATAAAALACGSGCWFVSGSQPGIALQTMTIGWLIALAAQTVGWVVSRRLLRRAGGTNRR